MKKILTAVLLSACAAVVILPLFAAEEAEYIGAKKCMICHKNERRGNQWGKWLEGPHSNAYETLKSEHSKEIANEMGIEDPTKADKCLKCHVTAYNEPASKKQESFDPTEGVGCEACHGPGSIYKSMRIMKALYEGTQDPEEVAFKHGDAETCLGCHNEESPTYKPFDYEEDWAKISHNFPE